MRTKLLFAAVLCLFFFSFAAYGQQDTPSQNQLTQMLFVQMQAMKSPMGQQFMKSAVKSSIRSVWAGTGDNLLAVEYLQSPDVRAAWGVSDEQHQQIHGAMNNVVANLQTNPRRKEISDQIAAIQKPEDPFFENADEETQIRVLDLQQKISALEVELVSEAIGDALTLEQKLKMGEMRLAILSEAQVVSASIFEGLNLTDDQKQQMQEIRKELEPEFEENLEALANASLIMLKQTYDELESQGGLAEIKSLTDMQKKIQEIQKKITVSPEVKKLREEIESKGKAFSTKFKTKMFDILTDEQWERLQDLIDNPPEYVKALLKKTKR